MFRSMYILVLMILLSLASAQSKADIIFSEDFYNDSGAIKSLAEYGWGAHRADNGQFLPSPSVSEGVCCVGDDAAPGIAIVGLQSTANYPALLWTNSINIDATTFANQALAVDWDWRVGGRNNEIAGGVRVAIQTGGNWYASAQRFTNVAIPFEHETLALSSNAADWLDMSTFNSTLTGNNAGSFGPGVALTTALPSQDITAFGFYFDNPVSTNYGFILDNAEISSVPAPSSGYLVGIALIVLLKKRIIQRIRRVTS